AGGYGYVQPGGSPSDRCPQPPGGLPSCVSRGVGGGVGLSVRAARRGEGVPLAPHPPNHGGISVPAVTPAQEAGPAGPPVELHAVTKVSACRRATCHPLTALAALGRGR